MLKQKIYYSREICSLLFAKSLRALRVCNELRSGKRSIDRFVTGIVILGGRCLDGTRDGSREEAPEMRATGVNSVSLGLWDVGRTGLHSSSSEGPEQSRW